MLQIKCFDAEHEKDLEKEVNIFLKNQKNVVDIKYQISHFSDNSEQIFSFSAMIIYEIDEKN